MPSAGATFAIACLVLVLPAAVVSVAWFWIRRNSQPIKSRRPKLVVFSDLVLVAFLVAVLVQRIVGDEYPCYLNLWTGFVGTVLLCNAYLVRCWLLYFDYKLTHERIKHYKDAGLDPDSFVVKYRRLSRLGVLVPALSLVSLFLLVPAALITATRQDDIVDGRGDDCDKGWGDAILAAYVFVYVVIFSSLAWNLRQVVDGFFVKEELKITGIVAALAVPPWLLFNTLLEDTNEDVFPFSSLVLVIAVTAALATSTVWPLYRSLYHPTAAAANLNVPERIDTLRGLLSYEPGYESFKDFLTTEFSVENLLFYTEVEFYRTQVAALPPTAPELVRLAHNIYAKYTAPGAPFEVNLPGNTVRRLKEDMKEMYKVSARHLKPMDEEQAARQNADNSWYMTGAGSSRSEMADLHRKDGGGGGGGGGSADAANRSNSSAAGVYDPPTLFDPSSKEIYHLMETDSYQRYVLTPAYSELLASYEETLAIVNVVFGDDAA